MSLVMDDLYSTSIGFYRNWGITLGNPEVIGFSLLQEIDCGILSNPAISYFFFKSAIPNPHSAIEDSVFWPLASVI